MSKFSDRDIEDICIKYREGYTQTSIAESYGVSRRTIGRVLRENGLSSPIKLGKREQEILDLVNKYNIQDAEQLDRIFNTPVLTFSNILYYMKEASEKELANMFFEAALFKIQERMHEHDQASNSREESAHAKH